MSRTRSGYGHQTKNGKTGPLMVRSGSVLAEPCATSSTPRRAPPRLDPRRAAKEPGRSWRADHRGVPLLGVPGLPDRRHHLPAARAILLDQGVREPGVLGVGMGPPIMLELRWVGVVGLPPPPSSPSASTCWPPTTACLRAFHALTGRLHLLLIIPASGKALGILKKSQPVDLLR